MCLSFIYTHLPVGGFCSLLRWTRLKICKVIYDISRDFPKAIYLPILTIYFLVALHDGRKARTTTLCVRSVKDAAKYDSFLDMLILIFFSNSLNFSRSYNGWTRSVSYNFSISNSLIFSWITIDSFTFQDCLCSVIEKFLKKINKQPVRKIHKTEE